MKYYLYLPVSDAGSDLCDIVNDIDDSGSVLGDCNNIKVVSQAFKKLSDNYQICSNICAVLSQIGVKIVNAINDSIIIEVDNIEQYPELAKICIEVKE
jgi:hypothetical protein